MPKVKYTAAKGLYQESGSGLDLTGDLALTGALSVASTLSFSNKLVGSVNSQSTAGAVSLSTLTTLVSTVSAPVAVSLAAGTAGQLKILLMTARYLTNDVTLTVTGGLADGVNNTITFNSVGDAIVLVYTGAKWAVVANNGAALSAV